MQINKADYLYNGVGNRTSLTDRRGAQSFGYDNLDRLTSASHPLLGTPQVFGYDAVGNRTTAGNVTNAGNQLTANATHSYQYDDNGNLTRKTLLATGNYTQYTYDAENRLTKVEDFVAGNPTPFATSTYRYDGLGRRIEKIGNGVTRRYVYDGEDILLEYDGNNVLQTRYTHGPGIDEPIAVTKGSATYFYHQDGLGGVTDLTDSTGATAKSYAYDAYGTIVDQTGTVDQPYTYTGREFDSDSGLYYYRARYYDPTTGRFLQPDRIGADHDDVSRYLYVGGNPINLRDPQGRAGTAAIGGAGFIVGTGLTSSIIGGAIIGSGALAAAWCYQNPDCSRYVKCKIQRIKDELDCIQRGICKGKEKGLIFDNEDYDQCSQRAAAKERRCRGGKPDGGGPIDPDNPDDGSRVIPFPKKQPPPKVDDLRKAA